MTINVNEYSKQVLSFQLKDCDKTSPVAKSDISKNVKRQINLIRQARKKNIIIFGTADFKFIDLFLNHIPDDFTVVICELSPARMREDNRFANLTQNSKLKIICDTSLWAHLMILESNNFLTTNSHLILNPSLISGEKDNHRRLQQLISGVARIQLPEEGNSPSLSLAAIISPYEPEIDKFIDNFPDWINEVVLIWDCKDLSEIPEIKSQHNIKNFARSLNSDFSNQRNFMLKQCTGDWILYLDADERLSNQSWENIKKTISTHDVDAVYLPRITFFPDIDHCRMGYGLWPDFQLRLFKKSDFLVFENPIHEVIKGYKKPAILTYTNILHKTHLLKKRESIEKKLAVFNEASGQKIRHDFKQDLPNMPFEMLSGGDGTSAEFLILP